MDLKDQITAALAEPQTLEHLYRQQPDAFQTALDQVLTEQPDQLILQAWQARLYYSAPETSESVGIAWAEVLGVVALCLVAGTLAKLPAWISSLDEGFFYTRNLAFTLFPVLAVYFLYRNRPGKRITGAIAAFFLVPLVYINVLPDLSNSQTVTLACLHLPFFLWLALGLSYTGQGFKQPKARMAYLRYNGEALIYTIVVLLCVLTLIGISLGLFAAIDVDVNSFYWEYVFIYGILAAPIVATHLTQVYGRVAGNLAPILARIFCPLVLITLVIYLSVVVAVGQNLFGDRNLLLIFNVMLLAVLAIVIFTVSERPQDPRKRFIDYSTLALVGVALLVDSVALAAIAVRLISFGMTPNRMVVLGANLITFINLAGVLVQYGRFFLGRAKLTALKQWITGYLPVYMGWTAFVIFGFPLIFRLQ